MDELQKVAFFSIIVGIILAVVAISSVAKGSV
jgi:hypothetical protein